jgi:hypothetical protein
MIPMVQQAPFFTIALKVEGVGVHMIGQYLTQSALFITGLQTEAFANFLAGNKNDTILQTPSDSLR